MTDDYMSIYFPEDSDLFDRFDDRFDDRTDAARDALEYRLIIDDVLGDRPLFADADDRTQRDMLRQALVDYVTRRLDE